ADLKRTTEHSTVTKYIREILTRRAHDVHVSGVNLLRLKELVHCKQMLGATVDLSDQQDALSTTDGVEIDRGSLTTVRVLLHVNAYREKAVFEDPFLHAVD
ncbi:hypothetical protein FOZ63_021710, partial [Perkinsus olseni]